MAKRAAAVGRLTLSSDRLFVIAGPCVIEALDLCLRVAREMKRVAERLGLPYVFKASYDKANRTSIRSFRGPGLHEGLQVLAKVKEQVGVPVLTDIHQPEQAATAAEVVDVLQVPAFLCRQTDLLVAAGETRRPVNIKKGQFVAPLDMRGPIEKVRSTGNDQVMVTERGFAFGYNRLVVDMAGLYAMRTLGCPLVFDATHAVQLPAAAGDASSGERELAPPLARAAAAVGIDALFIETHPDPDRALCDGPNMIRLDDLAAVLRPVIAIHDIARRLA